MTNTNNLENRADDFLKTFALASGGVCAVLGAVIGANNYSPEVYSAIGCMVHTAKDALTGGALGIIYGCLPLIMDSDEIPL